jgi:4'-phosphopantetheinyl transferase
VKTVEVHTRCVPLDVSAETIAGLYATLSPDERERSARFRFARDRQRFIAARGALRALLGRYLGTRPGEIRFAYNAFGKPALTPEFGGQLQFNLSHSGDLALIASTTDAEVGVDLECIRPDADYGEIARSVFSAAEVEQLNSVPSHLYSLAFLSCWTRKEASLKARGEGLAGLDLDGTTTDALTFQPAAGYVASVAVQGRTEYRIEQPSLR